MKYSSIILFSVVVYTTLVLAQAPDTLWTKTYGGEEREIGHAVYQTNDDGYIIAGITNSFGVGGEDIFLIRTDSSGDTLWTKTFGGTDSDWGCAVQQTNDYGYIIAGFTTSFGSGDNDVYLIKTDSSGDTLWTKTYGGAGDDRGLSVKQTSDNGYIITGITNSYGLADSEVYLIKTDSNGDTLWTKTYGGINRDAGYSVQISSDNGYIVSGYTSLSTNHRAIFLIRTDLKGDTVWTKIYGKEYVAIGFSVKQTSDNGYIITGTKILDSPVPNYDYYLIKTNENGDTLWTRTYGGEEVDIGCSGQQTSDGGYLLAGTKTDSPEGFADDRKANDIFLVKTDSNGDTIWTRILGGIDHDGVGESSNVMQETSDSGYIIVGSTKSVETGNIDVWLIKISPEATGVSVKIDYQPFSFKLYQNHPNPFNPSTTLKYEIPKESYITLKVYDILGREVATLVNKQQKAGYYEVDWNAVNNSSGVYFYRIQAGEFVETKKMVLLR